MFASRLRARVFSILFSFVNWIVSGSWSRNRVMFSAVRFTLSRSSPLPRNATLRTFFFFRIYSLCLSWDFCQPACSSFQLDLHWNSPKLPCGMQRICWPFVLKTIILCLISRLTLTNYSSLYFYTSDTFRPILTLFAHFALHQFFNMYITTRNIFLIPDDAVIGESSDFNFHI